MSFRVALSRNVQQCERRVRVKLQRVYYNTTLHHSHTALCQLALALFQLPRF